jgi:hypothetical protein
LGIKLVVDHYKNSGHNDICVILPMSRKDGRAQKFPTKNPEILEELYRNNYIMYTPPKSYDDRFVLEMAETKKALIISNDYYRDLREDYRELIANK